MPKFTIKENCPKYRFENGIWKGPSIIPPDGYFKYGKILLKTMRQNAHLIAQIDPRTGAEDTFGSMAERCIRCALWIKKQDINPDGDILSISTKNHLNSVIPLVSSLMIGSIINPWPYNVERDFLPFVFKLIRPKILFVEKDNIENMKKVIDKLGMNTLLICFQKVDGFLFFDDLLASQKKEEVANFKCSEIKSPDQPAIILFTSGTTDQLKPVVHSYGTLANSLFRIPPKIMFKAPGMTFCLLEWISGVTYFLNCIRLSATMILYTGSLGSDAFKLIDKYKLRWIGMSTAAVLAVIKTSAINKYNFTSVKYVNFGGYKVYDNDFNSLMKIFSNATITHGYGTTETAGRISEGYNNCPSGSCGKLVKNRELKVIDANGATIFEPFYSGEFCVRSPNIMLGYYENSELTSAFDADGWFHTGDIGYYNETGDLFIIDRMKDIIKCANSYIAPVEIENIIREHPCVDDVAVVGKYIDEFEQVPIAFVVKKLYVNVTEGEIMTLVEQQEYAQFNLKGGVKFMDMLPRTLSGKIRRPFLRQIAEVLKSE